LEITPQQAALAKSASISVAASCPRSAKSALHIPQKTIAGSSAMAAQATGSWIMLIAANPSAPCCWRAAFIAGTTAGV
jgi:hypothetical protein